MTTQTKTDRTFRRFLTYTRYMQGRYDFMLFLCKWDPDYRKDLIVTLLAFALATYSIFTINSHYDYVALAIEIGIIMVQLGGEMSILPADYRPSHGGVRYTTQPALHIAYNELSFPISTVRPAASEEAAGFVISEPMPDICKETAMVSDPLNNAVMARETIPYEITTEETNYIRSRHQIRYISIRVADRIQHTTNGIKLALFDMATALTENRPVRLRKSYYFDALLTAEAFRSRIFRNNIQGETEVYTDLTTYFPTQHETVEGRDALRFTPDLYKHSSGHIGITSLILTESRRVALLHQGVTKAIGARSVTLGGSGSIDFDDYENAGGPFDLKKLIRFSMAREVSEETGLPEYLKEIEENTLVTGFFRWVDRCGKPEFVGLTRAGNVPFSRESSIDADEVVRFEEIPVTVNNLEDFSKVMAWLRESKARVSLSSLMALKRLITVAEYNRPDSTGAEKEAYRQLQDFLQSQTV